jgi:vacuolar-type H+-ATPase subunit E/Vma4
VTSGKDTNLYPPDELGSGKEKDMKEKEFFSSLGDQAETEMSRIAGEAGEKSALILKEAEEEARLYREERLRFARADSEILRARTMNAACLEAKKAVLLSRHRIIEEALDLLREELKKLHLREDYRDLLERLFGECFIVDGSRLHCRRRDRSLVAEIARQQGRSLSIEESDIPLGGFVVSSPDGHFVQRNTFEDRIAKARPRLAREIASRVLPPENQGC